jgi:hypothetical protein
VESVLDDPAQAVQPREQHTLEVHVINVGDMFVVVATATLPIPGER